MSLRDIQALKSAKETYETAYGADTGEDDNLAEPEITAADEAAAAVAPMSEPRWSQWAAATGQPAAAPAAESSATPMVALKTVWTAAANVGNDAEVFCVRYSPDDALVAAGSGDGTVRVLHAGDGRLAYELASPTAEKLPVTCLRFRPASATSKTKNLLLVANADGTVRHWHVTSRKCLHTITEENNQVFAIDYRQDGARFATAGKDYTVRVYDEATKTKVAALHGGFGKQSTGHSNRVFSLKFSAADPNLLISAGWDNTIQVWDLRTEHAVRALFGAHICGDAVDLHVHTLVSGSWRPESQLQLWDVRTGELVDDDKQIPWRNPEAVGAAEPCQLYACQFSKDPGARLIAAGGTGANELRIFDREAHRAIGFMTMPKGVYGLDWSMDGKTVAVAGGDGSVRSVAVPL